MTTQDTKRESSRSPETQWSVVAHGEGQEPQTLINGVSEKVAKGYAKGFNRSDSIEQKAGRTIRAEAVQIRIDPPETHGSSGNTRILTDGVRIERYADQVCQQDSAGNDIEETRGHVWRLDVRPDHAGQLERDEDFSLYVEILDTDQPVEKAAFKRIYAAAEELQALARKIEAAYVVATGDIGPPPTAGDDLQAKYDADWGPEIVPNVRMKHDPKAGLIDDDGNEIEGARGHIHSLDFNDKTTEERGGLFILADYFDDRDAPTINEAAAKRLLEASGQLRDTALELAPRMAEQLSRLMVEITGPEQSRYVIAFKDPRVGFCENHNQRSTDGTTASIIERPTLADVPDMDFDQVKVKAGSNASTDNDTAATAQVEPRQ